MHQSYKKEVKNGGRVSEALVKENKNYLVNTLQNKTMAKSFTMAQLKYY